MLRRDEGTSFVIRQGRAGEHGFWFFALGVEGLKLAALILIPATVVLVGVGGYGAAIYDQKHSTDPLSGGPPGQSSPPSLAFTDFSPVGLHEDCILKVAAENGLSWDGGLGWTAGDPPRPRGADGLSDSKVQVWRNQMSGLLGRVSTEWHQRCDKADLPTPTPSDTPTPQPEAPVNVSGTYAVESGSLSDCPVVEGSNPNVTTLMVARGGDTVTLTFPGSNRKVTGPISSDLAFKATYLDPAGGGVDIDGRFAAGTGGDVLLREGNVSVSDSAGGGLLAHPCTSSFVAKKPGASP